MGVKVKNEAIMVACPNYKDFPEAPKDQSHSELFDCPTCKEKMWLSEKKKEILQFGSCSDRHIILGCYPCIKKFLQEDPTLLQNAKTVNI